MFQSVTVVGYLGRDPEMRYTPQGVAVTNFSVCANRTFTRADGSRGDRKTWYRVTAWRRMAEVCNEYLAKGRLVLVEGELTGDENGNPRIWERQDGSPAASFELTARTVKFLGRNGNGGAVAAEDEEAPQDIGGYDESIPF